MVLGCPSTGINKKGAAPKMREFLRICHKYGPVNLGDVKTGNMYNRPVEDILDRLTDSTVVQCTFDSRDKLVSALRELKENKPGVSVIVSGVTDIVQGIMYEAGLDRIHTIEYSMGTWGRIDRLPDLEVLKLTTMCGHAMVADNLVRKLLRDIKRGRITPGEASVEMAKCCTCGNFNVTRGTRLIREMLPLYMTNRY